jgi:hypothetical protein
MATSTVTVAATPTSGSTGVATGPTTPPATTSPVPPTTATSTAPATGGPQAHLSATTGLELVGGVILGMLLIGGIVAFARGNRVAKTNPQGSVIRSWIAVSLVMGLLVFCAAALAFGDSSLQSTLFGGLTTSVGAAVAFYFSSAQAAAAAAQGAVPPSTFTNEDPPDGKVGTQYSFVFTTDAPETPKFDVSDGSLPDGLTLTPDGTLKGEPARADTSTFAVRARNAAGTLIRQDIKLVVTEADD